jgi:hypothetical protein
MGERWVSSSAFTPERHDGENHHARRRGLSRWARTLRRHSDPPEESLPLGADALAVRLPSEHKERQLGDLRVVEAL